MHKKLIVNRTCPYCGNEVNDVLEELGDHRDAEWIKTKQGVKQYFHISCFYAASKGLTLQDVSRTLAGANTYVGRTVCDFTKMTRNIDTFTATINADKREKQHVH